MDSGAVWSHGRAVECGGLENRFPGNGDRGSNPRGSVSSDHEEDSKGGFIDATSRSVGL